MTIISLFAFAVFFFTLFLSFRKGSDFFSPARVFVLLWSLSIALVEFKFSRLQFEWDTFGWFMLLIGLLSFILGNYISYVINLSKPFYQIDVVRQKIRTYNINEPLLFKIIIISFIVFIFSFMIEFFIEGYVPIFTAQPDKARKMFGIFGLHLLVNGVNVILFLIAEYFILIKSNLKRKMLLSLIFLISTSSFFLLLQRYNFFMLGIMVFAFLYYSGKRIRLRTFLYGILIMASLVVIIRSVRIAQFAEYYFYVTSEMKFPIKYAFLSEPYMYITMNLENFVKNYDKLDFHTFGFFTTDFLMALSGLKHLLTEYLNVEKFPHYIGGYNTFPFYWAYYYDFGLIGLTFIPMILGFLISEVHYRLHRIPNLSNLALYTVGFAVILISYSSDPLTRLDMVFNFALIVLVQKYLVINQ
ncbi:MAG: oligosaccharide repeat unit polymerase [Bacteroidetes bacterium]|nr:oligosaccharide repeat unit polymerase [Bacteroidota bacterium]